MARRIQRLLERRGLADGAEPDRLAGEEPLLAALYAASAGGGIATGERAGQRVRRLGDRIDVDDLEVLEGERCASVGGVSLHANVAVPARDPQAARAPVPLRRPPARRERAALAPRGRDAPLSPEAPLARRHTTHVVFTPQELVEKLAALVPPPRFHLARYHGILGPCASERDRVVPAGAGPSHRPAPCSRGTAMEESTQHRGVGSSAALPVGAMSGFHALIASGTTPKLLDRESDARVIGYGAMLMESFVAIMALLSAAVMDPGVHFAINPLWPLFGIANQLLAAATTILVKSGRARFGLLTGLPLAWLLTVTMSAGWQRIFHAERRIGFLAQADFLAGEIAAGRIPAAKIAETQHVISNNRLDAAITALFMALVAIVVLDAARVWWRTLRSRPAPVGAEAASA